MTNANGSENGYQFRAIFSNGNSTTTNPATMTVLGAETTVTGWNFATHSTNVTTATLTGVSTTLGSQTVTAASTANLAVGEEVSVDNVNNEEGTPNGIPVGAKITAIVDATHFTISQAADLSVGNATATYSQPGYDDSPAPTTGVGTATVLGMNLPDTAGDAATTPTGSVAAADVTNQTGSFNPTFGENLWRIRGGATDLTGGSPNGWSNNAPQYTQGSQFTVPTTGYQNIYVTADWYGTKSGERDLQEQYTLDGTTWNNINNLVSVYPDDYYGAIPNGDASTNDNIVPLVIDVSKIPGAANNANFGIRLVNAYDPYLSDTQTLTLALPTPTISCSLTRPPASTRRRKPRPRFRTTPTPPPWRPTSRRPWATCPASGRPT